MQHSVANLAVAGFLLFVWLHAVPELFPTPAQQRSEIREFAETGRSARDSLEAQGVPMPHTARTVEELEQEQDGNPPP